MIIIKGDHNHSLNSTESLSSLRPSQDTRTEFESYFDSGLGIREACNYHQSKLQLQCGAQSKELANSIINPRYRTVTHWYSQWRKTNLGHRNSEEILEVLILEPPESIPEDMNMYNFEDCTTSSEPAECKAFLPSLKSNEETVKEDNQEICFEEIVNLFVKKNEEFDASLPAIKSFLQRLRQIKSKTQWENFLSTAGNSSPQS